jgi:hypothetical protein
VLRTAADADRDPVLVWRNHPEVRRASLTAREIGASEHAAWWAAGGRDKILIFEYAGRPAGVVTIEPDGTWGFYLDVGGLTERGELVPAWLELERAAIGYAFDTLRLDRLGGVTLAWNTPVLALHALSFCSSRGVAGSWWGSCPKTTTATWTGPSPSSTRSPTRARTR